MEPINITVCGVCGKPATFWTYGSATATITLDVYGSLRTSSPEVSAAYCGEHAPFSISPTLEQLYTAQCREVERLRAREAALVAALTKQGKLVELIAAEAWYGHDAPYYSEVRRIMEAHKHDWYTTSELQARALLDEPNDATTAE